MELICENLPGYTNDSFDIIKDVHIKNAVYILEHQKSGKIYIGSTNDFYARKRGHISDLKNNKNSNKNLQEAFNDDNTISYYVIPTKTRDEAFDFEQKLLDKYKDSNNIFNVAFNSRSSKGIKRSEETRKKISEVQKGKEGHTKGIKFDEERLTIHNKGREKMMKPVIINNQYFKSTAEAAKSLNMNSSCLCKRLYSNTKRNEKYNFVNI